MHSAIYFNDLGAINAHRTSNTANAAPDRAAAKESCHLRLQKCWRQSKGYFFLYPVGHLGFVPLTFFVILPLTQEIVTDFFATGFATAEVEGVGVGVGVGATATFSCDNFTLIIGEEKVKPLAER
jgi:hypothetical protein